MKLEMIDVEYVDLGVLVLPKAIYRDKKGNFFRYHSSLGEREAPTSVKELGMLLEAHTNLPKIIEGDVEFENKSHNFIGIRDKKGNLYRFIKITESPRSSEVERPAVNR